MTGNKNVEIFKNVIDQYFSGLAFEQEGEGDAAKVKIKIVDESAVTKAVDGLSTLVLEKARDIWDQLEAAEGSLAGVAEEISFEELNTGPDALSRSVPTDPTAGDEADAEVTGAAGAAAMESVSDALAPEDFNLDEIFEGMSDHLDSVTNQKGDGHMPFDENLGAMVPEDEGEDVVDGDDDYSDLEMGMDDAGMGSPESEESEMGDEFENGENGEVAFNGDNGENGDDYSDLDMEPEMGDDLGFEFDFALDDEGEEEEEVEGLGHGLGKSYSMEGEDKDDDDDKKKKDDDKDDDDKKDDDDDKPAFLKKDGDED